MRSIKVEKGISRNSVWFNLNFLFLWAGTSLSNLTFTFFTFSLPILIYEMTHSTLAMSSMRAIEVIPSLIFGMFLGVIVDRYKKKKLLIISVIIQLISIALICCLYIISHLNIWNLYLLGFIIFISGYLFGNAFHTIIPLVVSRDQLISANSIISLWHTIVSLIGPSLAGLLYIMISPQYSLLITIIGLLILLIFISMLNIPNDNKKNNNSQKSIWIEIKEGWIQLTSHNTLWTMTLLILFLNIANGLTGAVLIFYVLDSLAISKSTLGIIISSSGVGAIVASLVAKKSKTWFNRGALFLFMLFFSFIGQIILFLSQGWLWLATAMLIIGFATTIINIHYLTIRQESTPSQLLGRVAGTASMIMKLALPTSYLFGGILAEYIPIRFIFLFSALILLILTIFAYKKNFYKAN